MKINAPFTEFRVNDIGPIIIGLELGEMTMIYPENEDGMPPYPCKRFSIEKLQDPEILAEAGVPDEAQSWRVEVKSPLGWDGYTFELVGTWQDAADIPSEASQFALLPNLRLRQFMIGEIPDCLRLAEEKLLRQRLVCWRRRVFYKDIEAHLESVWDAKTGKAPIKIKNNIKASREEFSQLKKGEKLLLSPGKRPGRRPGRQISIQDLEYAFRSLQDADYFRPTQSHLADYLDMSVDTIQRILDDAGLSYADFVSQLLTS